MNKIAVGTRVTPRKAAERGWALAQNNLGVMYGTGQGVPQDDLLAHMWFNLAGPGAAGVDRRWRRIGSPRTRRRRSARISETGGSGLRPIDGAPSQLLEVNGEIECMRQSFAHPDRVPETRPRREP